jgi:heme A synthase
LQLSRSRSLVAAMFVVAAGIGVFQAYLRLHYQDQRIALVVNAFLFAPLLFAWCNADIKRRAVQPPPAAALLVAVVALVGVPYYFLKTLPLKRAAISIARALAIFLILSIVTNVALRVATRVLAS